MKNSSNTEIVQSECLKDFKEMMYEQYNRRKKAVNNILDLIFKELNMIINKVRRYEKQVNKESM